MRSFRRLVALGTLTVALAGPVGVGLAAGTVPTTPGYTIAAPATSAPAPASQQPSQVGRPAAAARHGGGEISNAAIALAAAGALLVLGSAGWAIYRLGGFQARWTVSLRHSVDEADYRLGETAAELRDWARLGR